MLQLLPDVQKRYLNLIPHQTQPDGTWIQATTVKTIVCVGLVATSEALPQRIRARRQVEPVDR